MKDKFTGTEMPIPSPEEFTQELIKECKDAAIVDAAIKEYSRKYHQIMGLLMNGKTDEANELVEELQ